MVRLLDAGTFRTTTSGYLGWSAVWIVGILVVFVPLAVRQFNRS